MKTEDKCREIVNVEVVTNNDGTHFATSTNEDKVIVCVSSKSRGKLRDKFIEAFAFGINDVPELVTKYSGCYYKFNYKKSDIPVKRTFKCLGCGPKRPCLLTITQERENTDTTLEDLKCVLDSTNQTSYNWQEL